MVPLVRKWLWLALSMILFPVSLAWYRRDIDHHRIPVVAYWVVMGLYVVANIVLTVYMLQNLKLDLVTIPEF